MRTILGGLVLILASLPALGQYPTKPVRMLVGFAPGGGVDIMARLLAQKITRDFSSITLVATAPVVVVASLSVPTKNLAGLTGE
jgi:hypothetical protein